MTSRSRLHLPVLALVAVLGLAFCLQLVDPGQAWGLPYAG